MRQYVRQVFSAREDPSPRMQGILDDCFRLFEDGLENDRPGVRGTVWAAYNAVTEYPGTQRGRTAEGRLSSLWFGESARLNQRAFEAALELAT